MFPIKTSKTSEEEFGKPLPEFKKEQIHSTFHSKMFPIVSYTDKSK